MCLITPYDLPKRFCNIYGLIMIFKGGKSLNVTQVGNAKLLGLLGLNPGTQLCNMHVPHLICVETK